MPTPDSGTSRERERAGRTAILLGGILVFLGAILAAWPSMHAVLTYGDWPMVLSPLGSFVALGCALPVASLAIGATILALQRHRPPEPGQS